MKHINRTSSHVDKPELHIIEKGGIYKVYDKNQHFRCSFATRAAAQAYIDGRTGKTQPQAAAQAAEPAHITS